MENMTAAAPLASLMFVEGVQHQLDDESKSRKMTKGFPPYRGRHGAERIVNVLQGHFV